MAGPTEITPIQLYKRLGRGDAPRVIDLRIAEDFADDPRQIPASLRWGHRDLPALLTAVGGAEAVLYCQKGRKISHGAAAWLRAQGVQARVLEGGQFAWRDAGLPMVTKPDLSQPSRWITRHRPKIDRVAVPWLIRRFVDPTAEFLFVPPQDVLLAAERFDAIPFDIEGVALSHSGDQCSFDAVLAQFDLVSEPLDLMAQIIRAADTDQLDRIPQAAGISALCLGLSRLHREDQAQLDSAMPLFDALYLWARDAKEERHDWPGPAGQNGAGK